ncbi:penicillin-binding protein activator LpoB [Proteus alimentorum]|uniref:Penicillin-binding protein activator LpoB n=1 Tax=Proteus alimentorum TaxID=1973495 RepID=A0ABS0IVQ2_9GAMM|nr:penicillin-binding protein activator LpoB [Proteus alimentorum]MBG2876610.1 penicillin-binding protein activator LpoB [Proteus alimentorum]MBG2880108.1 penicillin-binding protein activator LpoB [Proteus alimentorum]
MKRVLFVAMSVFLLAGCPSMLPQQPPVPVEPIEPVTPTEPVEPPKPIEPPIEVVPTPPKITSINWNAAVIPLIREMAVTGDLEVGKLIVVDNVKNNSGGNIQAVNATNTIIESVNSISALQTVPYTQMMSARKALGLSGEDSLGLRSAAIGLARYLKADYILFSTVDGKKDNRVISMQLMSVSSGEILWNGRHKVE